MPLADLGYSRPQNFVSGVNNYCPKLVGMALEGLNSEMIMDLGQPVTLSTTGLLNGVAAGATYTVADFLNTGDFVNGKCISCPWGRELDVVIGTSGTQNVDFYGRDYLGQPVKQTVALNGATRVLTTIAWKWIDRIVIAAGGSGNVSVGYTNKLGLEYRTAQVIQEFADAVRAGTLGTLVAPDLTDPQTAVTADPRGMYTPNTTPDGVKNIWIQALVLPVINSNGNGGLHGLQHFGG